MRILLVSESYPPVVSGVATVATSHARMARAFHHTVTVITANSGARSLVTTTQGIKTYRMKATRNYLRPGSSIPVASYQELKAIIERERPDIIHIHTIASLAVIVQHIAKEKHIPVVATVHGIPPWILTYIPLPKKLLFPLEYILWIFLIRFLNAATHVTVPSFYVKQELIRHGLKTACSFIPMWITKSKDRSVPHVHCNRKTTYYCFIGRLDVDKNVAFLIRSWIRYKQQQPDTTKQLLIIGSGTQETYLKRLARTDTTRSIQFLGKYEEEKLTYFYTHCHFFCMPALYETQSIVTLRAIAYGKMTILADSGALTEIKKRYPKHVLLYKPENQNDLIRCFSTAPKKLPEPNMEHYSEKIITHHMRQLYRLIMHTSS